MSVYGKKPLLFEAQADQLLARGLQADRAILIKRLRAVNYYRLSGYLFPFRQRDANNEPVDDFVPGTTLDSIWRRYNFDRRLRVLLLDVIERIEVGVRTQLIYHFAHAHGAFGYLEPNSLPGLEKISDYLKWRTKLVEETKQACNEQFVRHYFKKYGDTHRELPIWMLCELMSFGSLLTFARGITPAMQQTVAGEFGLPDELFFSWLRSLYTLRNACAHHSRIWNREFGNAPKTPGKNKFPNWYMQPEIPNGRVGYLLTICNFWLGKISNTSQWRKRLFALFDEYSEIPIAEMGLPANWREHPLWKN
jgi:abortive infection bacteriophage resistance protein